MFGDERKPTQSFSNRDWTCARDPGLCCSFTLWFLLSSRRKALLLGCRGRVQTETVGRAGLLGVVFQAPLIKEVTESG